ncbi:MAG: hypothetical protein PF518_18800 [Spirochaetaceae bacterium]|jgi:hypothetical protein|nr:hypothetical protein [Spirochaetaceae bacterium]
MREITIFEPKKMMVRDIQRDIELIISEKPFTPEGEFAYSHIMTKNRYKIRLIKQQVLVNCNDRKKIKRIESDGFKIVEIRNGINLYEMNLEYVITDEFLNRYIEDVNSDIKKLRFINNDVIRRNEAGDSMLKKTREIGWFKRTFRWKKTLQEIDNG